MNFHEYQAKQLFADYGIAVPAGRVARTPEEAVDAHSIQPYYTVLLADEAGMELDVAVSPEEIVFSARVVPASE